MPREFCYQCRRAKVTCLCGRIEKQPNGIKIIVLQHPDEVKNPKGSAIIAELGLQQYEHWIDEDFSEYKKLEQLLDEQADGIAILYPGEQAQKLTDEAQAIMNCAGMGSGEKSIRTLLLIDATWRKAKKIWESQPLLQALPAFELRSENSSNYRIRKVPKEGYLSTVESVVAALRLLEQRPEAYQSLLDLFDEMVDFQIEKMGKHTYEKNYGSK